MIKARIELRGMKEVQDEFRDINANQIPFATAKSLTVTAQQGQQAIREQVLPGHFILRQPAFLKQGIRITAATKAKLEAIVGDIDAFMELQETGGTKLPYKEFICVPIIGGARPSLAAKITDANKPHAVMQNGGFIRNGIMYRLAKSKLVIGSITRDGGFLRIHNKRVRVPRGQPVPMYVLVKLAAIKPRYGFLQAVATIVEANFRNNFALAFQQAVRTAKR